MFGLAIRPESLAGNSSSADQSDQRGEYGRQKWTEMARATVASAQWHMGSPRRGIQEKVEPRLVAQSPEPDGYCIGTPPCPNPMGKGFDYAEAFNSLNLAQ